ncbi:helix-turn-helix transcriptional regulator [Gloeothece verrucosa]|nr:helix-turn-helix transcriptional regulator [Gloeothece verrucosa]
MKETESDKNITPLRKRRESANLTRPDVKRLIGVSERRQADWESGKAMPSLENAAALAKLYGISLKTLFFELGIDVSQIPDDKELVRNNHTSQG